MSELWHQRTATGRFGASPGKKCGFGCDFPSAGANNRMTAHVATAVGATKRKPMTTPALQERFQALMDEHKKILYKVCNSYCRNRDDRDDLAQEIIIQVWRSFGKFDERYRFSTWMYRIALNVAISFYRRESTRTRHVISDDDRLLNAIDETVDQSQEKQLLYQFIEKLDPLNKALVLLYLDGNSHQEIADVLGISETNVATKIGRLKKTMKQDFSATAQT
jgi:RNA polymerase sigma-70 factor (ECF subfamily)